MKTIKWIFSSYYQKNSDGFTLLELLTALSISSLLLIIFLALLNMSIRVTAQVDLNDRIMSSGRYAIDYMTNEIKSADGIARSDRLLNNPYRDNFGFVLKFNPPANSPDPFYQYVFYILKDKKIYRVSKRTLDANFENLDMSRGVIGLNAIIDQVKSIAGSGLNDEARMVFLSFEMDTGMQTANTSKFQNQVYLWEES